MQNPEGVCRMCTYGEIRKTAWCLGQDLPPIVFEIGITDSILQRAFTFTGKQPRLAAPPQKHSGLRTGHVVRAVQTEFFQQAL